MFSRFVEAVGSKDDVLLAISTSGNSENLVEAFQIARDMNITCVALLGADGGDLLPLADAALIVPSDNTQRILEVQILILHLLCELIENPKRRR